jgi:hypothetical protein
MSKHIRLVVEGVDDITTILDADKIEYYSEDFTVDFQFVQIHTSMENLLEWKETIDELLTRFDMEEHK